MDKARSRTRFWATLMAGAVFATAAQAQAPQTPSRPAPGGPAATDVSPLTVTRARPKRGIEAGLPTTDAPRSATCEYLVAKDTFLQAQMAIANGRIAPHLPRGPVSALLGPTIRLPTRLPRSPDYSAQPITAPGSALPEVRARGRGRVDTSVGVNASMDVSEPATVGSEGVGLESAGYVSVTDGGLREGEYDLSVSIGDCRSGAYSPTPGGNARFAARRMEMAARDKLMPMGFALFDEGRYAEALQYFRKAHAKFPDEYGGDEAALMIGKIHLLALGEKSDTREAITWLKKAANSAFNATTSLPVFDPFQPQRNTAIGEAAVILGNIHLTGFRGAPKDPAQARKWFERASYVGHVPAAKTLGDLYYHGIETPRDVAKATAYYRQAASLAYRDAQYALAELYQQGAAGLPADRKAALAWYSEAAKYDHPGALQALAAAYDLGEGVAADPQKALIFYKAAAVTGNADAQSAMGTYFYQGELVAKDHAMARRWFETAAARGQPDAMFNLAAMLTKGEGGDRDLVKAWVWFSLAKARGHANAATALAAVEKQMSDVERQAANNLLTPKTTG